MPETGAIDGLRLDLQTLDKIIAAYRLAADQMRPVIRMIELETMVPSWMEDPTSHLMANTYNAATFDGPNSTHARMRKLQSAFQGIIDTFERMRAEYLRTEGDIAATFSVAQAPSFGNRAIGNGGPL